MTEMKNTSNQARQASEIAIKFGKGLAQAFTDKDGTQYMRIQIPNKDSQDKLPWQYFVVPAKSVHENRYGKGLWIKVPLHGSTRKPLTRKQAGKGLLRHTKPVSTEHTDIDAKGTRYGTV